MVIELPGASLATLLIVEDQRQLCDLLAVLAEELGWHAVTATNSETALDWLSTHQPDAALIDVGLPGVDGLALAAKLRGRYPYVPVVIMTALGQARQMAAAASSDFYLDKPFDLREFRDMMDRVERHLRATSVVRRGSDFTSGAAPSSAALLSANLP